MQTIVRIFIAGGNLFLRISKKYSTFAGRMDFEQQIKVVEEIGIYVEREVHGFNALDVDVVFPNIVLTLCTQGKARALYDMQEMTQEKNQLGIVMPGHILHPLDSTADYTYARMIISPKLFEDLRSHVFSHDYDKFNYSPICTLTDVQAERLLSLMDHLALISNHTEEELPHRYGILLAQLSVAYEYINYYRREQDKYWSESRPNGLFKQFCELVVEHYCESKEIQFYADLLHLHPKYLSRVIRSVTHGLSPKDWIEQYVVAQAKRQIAADPSVSLKQIAFSLGFTEPTSFYRYFKRVTGMTALEYRRLATR